MQKANLEFDYICFKFLQNKTSKYCQNKCQNIFQIIDLQKLFAINPYKSGEQSKRSNDPSVYAMH